MQKKYIQLNDLEVYKLARGLSEIGWEIYESLEWQDKKIKEIQEKLSIKLNNFINSTYNAKDNQFL